MEGLKISDIGIILDEVLTGYFISDKDIRWVIEDTSLYQVFFDTI